jgi:hypothetical protein
VRGEKRREERHDEQQDKDAATDHQTLVAKDAPA